MADWDTKALGDLCEVIGGGTPSKDQPEYYGGSIPWATVRDMRADVITTTEHSITPAAVKASSTNIIPSGNVVIATRVGLGKVCLLGQDTAINQDLRGIVPKTENQIHIPFLFAWLKSIADKIVAEGTGATVQGVKLPFIKGLSVPVPTMPEQRRIVAILDEAFEGIATAEANAEKNLQNARELFVHQREVILSPQPGWREAPLAELCTVKHGYAFEGAFFSASGEHVLLTPGSFYEAGGYRERGEKTKYFVGPIPEDYVLSAGDLLVAMTEQAAGLLGSPLLVPESNRFLHNQRLGLIVGRVGVPWSNDFFFHVFNLLRVRQEIHASASGAKVRHTSPGKIGLVNVTYPDTLDEQHRIGSRLVELDDECRRLEDVYQRKISALDELKKSLLHQAFSGKL